MKTNLNPDAIWSIRGVPIETRRQVASRARAKGMKVGVYLEHLLTLDRESGDALPVQSGHESVSTRLDELTHRLTELELQAHQRAGSQEVEMHRAEGLKTGPEMLFLYDEITEALKSHSGRVDWNQRAAWLNDQGMTRPDLFWSANSLRAWMSRMRTLKAGQSQ